MSRPKTKRVLCRFCQRSQRLMVDGMFVRHPLPHSYGKPPCPGSHQTPELATELAEKRVSSFPSGGPIAHVPVDHEAARVAAAMSSWPDGEL